MSSSEGKPVRAGKPLQAGPGGGPPRPGPAERPAVPVRSAPRWSRSQRILLGVGLGTLIVVIVVAAIFVSVQLSGRVAASRSFTSAEPDTRSDTTPAPPEQPPASPAQGPAERGSPSRQAGLSGGGVPVRQPSAPAPPPQEPQPRETSPAQPEPSAGPPPTPATAAQRPLDDIRARDRFLPLPPPETSSGTAGLVELAKVHVGSPSECDLSILGSEVVLGKFLDFVLKREDTDDGARTWPVQLRNERGLGRDRPVGTFQMKDDSLSFAWKPRASGAPAMLRYCLLDVKAGGERERCFLSRPAEVVPTELKFLSGVFTVESSFDARTGPEAANVRLDLQLEGFPPYEIDPPAGWKPGETGTIEVSALGGAGEPLVEIQVQFKFDDKCQLACRTFGLETLEMDDPPDEKPKIGRSSLAKHKQKWSKGVKRLKKNLIPIERDIEEAKVLLKALESTSSSSFDRSSGSYERRQLLRQILSVREPQRAHLEKQIEFYESLEEWAEEVEKLFDHLEADGRLGFRIYIEIDGEEVEILRTNLEDSDS